MTLKSCCAATYLHRESCNISQNLTHFDIIIVGGALAGAVAAVALARQGFSVAVIEKQPLEQILEKRRDGRTTAIAAGSRRFLEEIAIWQTIGNQAQPIEEILITDQKSAVTCHFDRKKAGLAEPLGHIIPNNAILAACYDVIAKFPAGQIYQPATVIGYTATASSVEIEIEQGPQQKTITAQVCLAVDGKFSTLRQIADIPTTVEHFPHAAITATITHSLPHADKAFECFQRGGPIALLPLLDNEAGKHQSCLVWTEQQARAEALTHVDEKLFLYALQRQFGDYLGDFTAVSPRFCYPLSQHHASVYAAPRLALAAEAAHSIHPIAGQGFNLSVRDLEMFCRKVTEARYIGADIGSSALLAEYEQARRPDVSAMILATQGLNSLFLQEASIVKAFRRMGLAVVERVPPLKKGFMQHAMGISGLARIGL